MLTGALTALAWALIATIGAVGGLAFILGMKSA